VSPALASLLNKKYGGNNTPWIYMPNMVDTDFFCPQAPPGSGTVTAGQPFIFFVLGFLTAIKGHRYLIEGFAQNFRGENVQLWIGGDGEERSRLESVVREAGIQDQVAFLGAMSREQVRQAMLQCHAFVLPSLYETFGVVIIEALACGKPVVATHCGGPEHLVNSRNGLLVPPGDAAALGRAMKHIVSHILEYEPADIRAECVASFGRDAVVRQLDEIYRGLAGSSLGKGVE
jgi:glycosyltransferase involved in cell wall biosynthesis